MRSPQIRYCAVCGYPVFEATEHRRVRCGELCTLSDRGIRSARDAVILELRYGHGLTPGMIAEMYGIGRQTVNSALGRQ